MGKSICPKNALLHVSPSRSKYTMQKGFLATLCLIFALSARNCFYGRGFNCGYVSLKIFGRGQVMPFLAAN